MLKQQLHDFVPVGIYTIGYGLALNINMMLHAGLGVAYNQVSIRLFETKGPQAVVQTKRAVLNVLVYIVAALIVGTIVAGPDLLLFLSGHDKFRSAPVFVWVTVTYVLSGLLGLCGSGLLLHKRSGTILILTAMAAIANIALNWFWIPAYGYMGAVYATAASLIGLNCMQFVFCPRELRALPTPRTAVIATGLAVVVGLIAHFTGLFDQTGHLPRLIAMAFLMLAGFVLPAVVLDRSLRGGLYRYWKLRGMSTPS